MWIRFALTLLFVLLLMVEQPVLLSNPMYWVMAGLLLGGVTSERIWRNSFWLYFFMILSICGFAMYTSAQFIVWLLPLLFMFFYSWTEQATERRIMTLGLLVALSVVVTSDSLMERLFLCAFVFFVVWCILHAHRAQRLLTEKNNGFEELSYEYKKLKRQISKEADALKQAERTRIARDVHDSVGHQLTGLIMQLQMIDMQTHEAIPQISQAKEMARAALQHMRHAVQALESDEKKGVSMIIQLIRKLEAESHVRVSFTTKAGALSVPLTDEQSVALYRFVQEGLTNAMRHAYARKVNVIFALEAEQTYVVTMSNTVGEEKKVVEGFGLTQLRNRFENLGGTFRTRCTDHTFLVEGTFPLSQNGGDHR